MVECIDDKFNDRDNNYDVDLVKVFHFYLFDRTIVFFFFRFSFFSNKHYSIFTIYLFSVVFIYDQYNNIYACERSFFLLSFIFDLFIMIGLQIWAVLNSLL